MQYYRRQLASYKYQSVHSQFALNDYVQVYCAIIFVQVCFTFHIITHIIKFCE